MLFVQRPDGLWIATDRDGNRLGGPARTAVGAYEHARHGKPTLPPEVRESW